MHFYGLLIAQCIHAYTTNVHPHMTSLFVPIVEIIYYFHLRCEFFDYQDSNFHDHVVPKIMFDEFPGIIFLHFVNKLVEFIWGSVA